MQVTSRRFNWTCIAFALITIVPLIAKGAEPKIIAGPFFTMVTPDELEVWFQSDRPSTFGVYVIGTRGDCVHPRAYVKATPLSEKSCIYSLRRKVKIPSYWQVFLAWSDSPIKELCDWNELNRMNSRPNGWPPHVGKSGRYTLAFGSCSHQEKFATKQPIWSAIAKEKPDCFLFIGDNMYLPSDPADYPKTREEVFKLYCDTYDRERQLPEMQELLRSTMSFGLWDDHDYGPNNSDRTWKWKDVALEAFKLYFPGEYGLPDAPGCFRKFSWGDIDVFILDDRTFRDPNKDGNRKTMFGEKQLAWLKEGLAASKATFKLVVCGNQMLSDFHPHEGWGVQFRPERDAFLRWLWDAKIEGVIFLAGDRHFAELIRKKDPLAKGEDLWELTSSPLANDSFKVGDKVPDGDRRASYVDGPNFGILRFDTAATPPNVKLILKDEKGKTRFQKKLYRRAQ